MSHSPVFLGSDQLDRNCIENLRLPRNIYVFGLFSYMALVAVSVQWRWDTRQMCIKKEQRTNSVYFSFIERGKSLCGNSEL